LVSLFFQLLPLIIVGAMTPTHVLAVIILLDTSRPIRTAGAFVVGLTLMRTLTCLIALLFFRNISWTSQTRDSTKALLTLLIGLTLLGTAGWLYFHKPAPTTKKPYWESFMRAATPVKAFVAGIGLMIISPRHLAIAVTGAFVIGDSHIGLVEKTVMLALFIGLIEFFVWLPIALYLIVPERATVILARGQEWYAANARPLMIGVSGVLGAGLLLSGMVKLIR
jgi:hypothetical protein